MSTANGGSRRHRRCGRWWPPASMGGNPARVSTTTRAKSRPPRTWASEPGGRIREDVSVDQDSIERIRSATFPIARKGYDKREVERFLNGLADWLEGGGSDQALSEVIKRGV